ncbi:MULTISPECIES: septum formation initiator family protein [Gordonia]|jgi:cell division protein FtsB|uniref:Septum formation initiator n=1 Tax=Gordonia alkanivorans CGMCC 6845 TaxID=1423140 RepID=W9DGC1_9ACTN|nr:MULTISPECIES: septum formation initiator family protein [Gordonia]ETA08613.1 Septum formation initiator [Gordonia alkanivorans CGMCC 6845]MDH3005275.1 septum formation initiator family protein [Gordonia alkanivorans]MDH3010429.1 septum formation initiator family protein [Gordonia alkanivorans]MDH3014687.1 septum formation initiator family protein [Gordonia alkanivorans]MDH3019221.1 septum formation initiator family protein [Gordonia alkanivorans]
MGSERRHRGDGRQRARDRKADPRVRDARRTRRHDRSGRPARPVAPASVVETGEQELITDATKDTADEAQRTAADTAAPPAEPVRRPRPNASRSRMRSGLSARLRRFEMTPATVATLVITVVVVCVVALTLAMPLRTYFTQRSEFRQLTASNEQLRREVADYQQKVNEQNDPAYIEAQARTRLQFVKPGEIPLVMLFPADQARREAAERAEERARAPWYGNLWDTLSTPPAAQ